MYFANPFKVFLATIRHYAKLRWYQTKKILPQDWRLLPSSMIYGFLLEIFIMILIPNPFIIGIIFSSINILFQLRLHFQKQ